MARIRTDNPGGRLTAVIVPTGRVKVPAGQDRARVISSHWFTVSLNMLWIATTNPARFSARRVGWNEERAMEPIPLIEWINRNYTRIHLDCPECEPAGREYCTLCWGTGTALMWRDNKRGDLLEEYAVADEYYLQRQKELAWTEGRQVSPATQSMLYIATS